MFTGCSRIENAGPKQSLNQFVQLAQWLVHSLLTNATHVQFPALAHVSLVCGHQAGQVGFLRVLRFPPHNKITLSRKIMLTRVT